MEIGVILSANDPRLAEDKKNNVPVVIGISAKSLAKDIEFYLYATKYDAAATLQKIHEDIFVATGDLATQEQQGENKDVNKK